MGKIGLKLANGAFYPVMDEGRSARKRLVVTTVADGQRSVQIDIYRGEGERIADSGYVGSLVIENIPEAPKGEPDIRLELGLAEDGTLSALAQDPASGEHQSLRISLESLEEEEKYEIPDFEFEEETDELPASAASQDEEDDLLPDDGGKALLDEGLDDEEPEAGAREPSKARRILFIALVAALFIALALAFSFFVYRCSVSDRPSDSIVETEEAAPAPAAPKPEPPKVEPAPAAAAAAPAAVEPAKAVATPAPAVAPAPPKTPPVAAEPAKPAAGVRYRLRWGDTLWDLAYAYYRNPWLYPRIAKANGIKNPDRIIAGRTITIPPR